MTYTAASCEAKGRGAVSKCGTVDFERKAAGQLRIPANYCYSLVLTAGTENNPADLAVRSNLRGRSPARAILECAPLPGFPSSALSKGSSPICAHR